MLKDNYFLKKLLRVILQPKIVKGYFLKKLLKDILQQKIVKGYFTAQNC